MSDIAMMIAIAKKFGGGSSTPAPVVILPETEMTPMETNGVVVGFMGTPTLTAYPEAGKTYTVTVNGTQHNLVSVSKEGMNGFIAPDETWVVLVVQPEYVEQFGCTVAVEWHSEEVPDSLTISIVQTEGASDDSGNAGGLYVVKATEFTGPTTINGKQTYTLTLDKGYTETVAALIAGKQDVVLDIADLFGTGSFLRLSACAIVGDALNFAMYTGGASYLCEYAQDGTATLTLSVS